MISRRGLIASALGFLAAPAIVRASKSNLSAKFYYLDGDFAASSVEDLVIYSLDQIADGRDYDLVWCPQYTHVFRIQPLSR